MRKGRAGGAAKGALLGLAAGIIAGFGVGAFIAWRSRAPDLSVDPSQKARLVAQGISEGINTAAFLVLLSVPIGAVWGARRTRRG